MRCLTHSDMSRTLRLLGMPSRARMDGSSEYVPIHFEPIDLKEFDSWLVSEHVCGLCWEIQANEFMWHDVINNGMLTRSPPKGTIFAPEFGIEDRTAKIYNFADYKK